MNPGDHSTPDLIKVTEIFLVPSSFLVAALGTADTNLHRAAVSLLGLVVSVLWWISTHDATAETGAPDGNQRPAPPPRRRRILSLLPMIFVAGWFGSTVIHAIIWNRPLGTDPGLP